MTSYRHLFVIDPLEKLNMKLDSSLRMAFALTKMKQSCYITTPKQISRFHKVKHYPNGCVVQAQKILFENEVQSLRTEPAEVLDLKSFQSVHMRKDPPFDMDYLAATWLLDEAQGSSIVYNDPEALRRWNEKLIILRFPDYTNPAIFSADQEQIYDFIAGEAKGDGILKPLDLFGGRGVIRLQLADLSREQALAAIAEQTNNGESFRLVQPFDSSIYEGEVRVFCAGTEALAWCLKKPSQGEFLANTRMGATLHPYQPSSTEEAMVQSITAELVKDGIFFTGFDLIGGKVSEINITSPRLLGGGLDEAPIYERLARLIIEDVERRLA